MPSPMTGDAAPSGKATSAPRNRLPMTRGSVRPVDEHASQSVGHDEDGMVTSVSAPTAQLGYLPIRAGSWTRRELRCPVK
jgi:hypothetical protein